MGGFNNQNSDFSNFNNFQNDQTQFQDFDFGEYFPNQGDGKTQFTFSSNGQGIDPSIFKMFFGPGSSNSFNFSTFDNGSQKAGKGQN